jgi:hypothetical protein
VLEPVKLTAVSPDTDFSYGNQPRLLKPIGRPGAPGTLGDHR